MEPMQQHQCISHSRAIGYADHIRDLRVRHAQVTDMAFAESLRVLSLQRIAAELEYGDRADEGDRT